MPEPMLPRNYSIIVGKLNESAKRVAKESMSNAAFLCSISDTPLPSSSHIIVTCIGQRLHERHTQHLTFNSAVKPLMNHWPRDQL